MRKLMSTLVLVPTMLGASEGKWTPDQIVEHRPDWLREAGVEVPPATLWDGEKGLLRAAVQVGGCSAGVVSPAGLVLTNHHCAFGLIQQHSSPDNDLITNGFLASNLESELPGKGTRARVPWSFRDVTEEVEAALAAESDDRARAQRLDRLGAALVTECEQRPGRRCELVVHDDGVRYVLVETLEFPDVRLVWAPPRAIGEYGGEVDNWSWPRHTGDFAVLRIWAAADGSPAPHAADNRPWRPDEFFSVSTEGVSVESAVMLAGYPGLTFRSLIADEAQLEVDGRFATRARIYADWIEIMTAAGSDDDGARIALASRLKTLANREKNARGQLEAITARGLIERRRRAEAEVLAWAEAKAPAVVAAHEGLAALAATARTTLERDRLLVEATAGPLLLDAAIDLVRWATERPKPDLERRKDYRDRDRSRLVDQLTAAQKRLHAPTEAALIVDLARRAAALGPQRDVPALRGLDEPQKVHGMVTTSQVFDLDRRLAMLDLSSAELGALNDPILNLAIALEAELELKRERDERRQGAELRLRPVWRRGMAAALGRPLDPDANGSLRLSFGRVRGYAPRDGVLALPQTTLAGLLAKHTGEDPFDAPATIRAAAADPMLRGRWNDPALGDVPIGFLATADTTGGNSGSPVLDGQGRLVGLNFDRVWENIANDFGYDPRIARNVSVDVRYLLWTLEVTGRDRAKWLLDELLGARR